MLRTLLRIGRRPAPQAGPAGASLAPPVGGLRPDPHAEPPEGDDADGVIYQGRVRPMTLADWEDKGHSAATARKLIGRDMAIAEVLVISPDGVTPLTHYPFHSPLGFAWGYGGSAPAELARCILLDHYGIVPRRRGSTFPPSEDELPVSYQDFKWQCVASLPSHRPWSMSATQIRRWCSGH